MHLLRDSTSNARWLEENINDFSLTSLLGHLDDFDATRDILVSDLEIPEKCNLLNYSQFV